MSVNISPNERQDIESDASSVYNSYMTQNVSAKS